MKTIGFPIGHKKGELRRCLIPRDLPSIHHKDAVFVETGYGDVLGYTDEDYLKRGVHVSPREEILTKDIICDPKIGDADYLDQLCNQTIWGWIHAVQNRDITDKILRGRLTAIAWEDMFYGGRHSFYMNNEMAGGAGVFQAFLSYGLFPQGLKVAVIGRGNSGRGALKVLSMMGAFVTVYDRHTENLFREEMGRYDAIVNCVLWDTSRRDHIISRADLPRLKPNALIVDVSCDRGGGIETSIPTTMDDPTYEVDGITHYVVDNIPSLFYRTISPVLSGVVAQHLDEVMTEKYTRTISDAVIIKNGEIQDQRITAFQHR